MKNKLQHTGEMIREFTLESLQGITNNFSEEHKIGVGGYGKVYKGVLDNGEEIALKRLHYMPELDDTVFRNEFSNLMKAQHKNITRLVGYCFHTGHQIVEHNGIHIFAHVEERVLCIEYLQNGSLDNYISDESCGLGWHIRYKIINGVCEGLNFLHNGNKDPIYHMDLKPANILLDQGITPKIGDFGLSRLFPTEHTFVTTKMIGTRGYMPPEYVERCEITNKFDVFSLGVIIIKVIAGDEGYSTCPSYSTQEFVEYVHENWRKRLGNIMSSRTSEEVITCLKIALECVEVDRVRRPTISEVVTALNKINNVKSSPISEGGQTFEDSNDELIKNQRVIPEKEKPLALLPTEETHVEQMGEKTFTEATTSGKDPDDYDFLFKLVLLGDSGWINALYFPMSAAYYRGTMGILLVVTDERSFSNIRRWNNDIEQHAPPNVSKILVGNITDLYDRKRVVTTSRGQALADELGIIFFETCAKTNLNVDQVFFSLTREIIQRLPRETDYVPKDPAPESKLRHKGPLGFGRDLFLKRKER